MGCTLHLPLADLKKEKTHRKTYTTADQSIASYQATSTRATPSVVFFPVFEKVQPNPQLFSFCPSTHPVNRPPVDCSPPPPRSWRCAATCVPRRCRRSFHLPRCSFTCARDQPRHDRRSSSTRSSPSDLSAHTPSILVKNHPLVPYVRRVHTPNLFIHPSSYVLFPTNAGLGPRIDHACRSTSRSRR